MWKPSGIGDYRWQDEQGRTWTIRELLDSDALAAEGKAMSHCVATFTQWCARGVSTIWSLGIEAAVPGERQRVLTIEVSPETREVVQAKRRDNEAPDETCRVLVEEWARQEGLKVAW
jgi:hypothetical protein